MLAVYFKHDVITTKFKYLSKHDGNVLSYIL